MRGTTKNNNSKDGLVQVESSTYLEADRKSPKSSAEVCRRFKTIGREDKLQLAENQHAGKVQNGAGRFEGERLETMKPKRMEEKFSHLDLKAKSIILKLENLRRAIHLDILRLRSAEFQHLESESPEFFKDKFEDSEKYDKESMDYDADYGYYKDEWNEEEQTGNSWKENNLNIF